MNIKNILILILVFTGISLSAQNVILQGGVNSNPFKIGTETLLGFYPSKRFYIGDTTTTGNTILEGITFKNRYGVPGTGIYRGDSYFPLIFESPTQTSEATSFMFRHSANANQTYPGGCVGCGGLSPSDSTRNEVFAWGFNINGRQKPTLPGLHYAIEPSWYNGGQLWQEAHLEWYNPYFNDPAFKAKYGNRLISRPFTTQIKNIKNPLLTTSDWSFQCDNMTWINTKSGYIYSVMARDDINKNTVLEMTAGNNFGMRTTVDSINQQITILRLPVASNQNYYKIQGFGRFSLTDDAGRNIIESVSQSQEVFFGQSNRDNSYTFLNNGGGSIKSVQNLTTSNYTGRGHFALLNAAQDDGINLGFRNDAKFFFMAQKITSAFSSSFKSYSFGRTISGNYPQGSAFYNIYTEQANTKPVMLYSTSTDSAKVFVTNATPNSLLTGRIGDVALGTNGGFYFKKTGSNTNTGWVDFAALVTESTSIGAFQSSGNSNGLTLSGTDIRLHAASVSTPGGVNVGLQTFGVGADTKIFNGTGSGQITVDGNTDNTPAGINFTQIGGTDLMGLFHINSSDADNARLRFALEQDGGLVDQIVVGTLNDDRGMYSRNGLYEDVTTVTTSPYTVLYGDRNIYLDGTTITVNLQAIGTSTAETKIGRVIYFFNDNATSVTLTPNGSETINDASSLTLLANTGVTLLAVTGTKWITRD